ncbi:RNA polymerase sigma factor [Acidicapsa ligni]|uniref:RNA polymerase sigma factor n=1 Tax=Acidicapsa ligni TaxID=542300 RepID=UPI0021DFEC43|nr:sigma-70 family RNA polymerase sigma factor [Acidicapsa ligni]
MSVAVASHTQSTSTNLRFPDTSTPEVKVGTKLALVRGEGVVDMDITDEAQSALNDNLDRASVRRNTFVSEEHIGRIFHLFPRASAAGRESDREFHGGSYDEILALYREYRPKLFAYVRSLYLTKDEAEDVIQETFLRLTNKLLQKVDIENVQGWVVHVAHDLAVDVLRRRDRDAARFRAPVAFEFESLQDRTSSPEEMLFEKEQRQAIETALLRFTPQQQRCFHLRAEGFLYKDIGLALGISEQRAALIVKQVIIRLTAVFG